MLVDIVKWATTIFMLLRLGLCFKHRAPIFESVSGDIYHGTLKESDSFVELSPDIRIVNSTGPVCRYVTERFGSKSATSDHDDWTLPFDITVLDKESGTVRLSVKKGFTFDCSDSPYRFYLRAERCEDLNLSDKILIEVRISDTNNHEPRFERDFYSIDIEPDRLYDVLVQLRAYDADCGHPYGEICRYEISDGAKHLFHISESGVLRNVVPLNDSMAPSYVMSVKAFDCGMRQSITPAVVRINVIGANKIAVPPGSHVCSPGVGGLAEKLTYQPGRGALPLFSAVSLELCAKEQKSGTGPIKSNPKHYVTSKKGEPTCSEGVSQLEAKISLLGDSESNELTSQYCDRENLSLDAQKKICGADQDTIELLPNVKTVHIENGVSGQKTGEALEDIYMFDGISNAVIVPDATTDANFTDRFSVNFWMRREKPKRSALQLNPLDQKHTHWNKENILCLSDDHRMNRHHFAIYAKHCKLEVLIRRERSDKKSSNGEDEYEPAEWRWRLSQLCDNNWHHYALRINFPKIDLLIDGVSVEQSGSTPEVLDDWPMHHAKDLKNRLVVGACWQGSAGKTYQHFKGYLSGLTVLPRKIERSSVLDCFLQCKERLEFVGLAKLESGEEAIFNRDMNDLTLKAKRQEDFADMLRKVSYINSKSQPTVGDRFVRLIATVTCKENSAPVLLPVVETRIVVKSNADVVELRLKAEKSILDYSEKDISNKGVALFPDLKILTIRENKAVQNDFEKDLLDNCKVTSEPEFDKTREYFSSPSSLIGSIPNLDFEQVSHGLLVKGQANVRDYEKILEQIHYFNSRPNKFSRRVFSVQCTMYNGRIRSNEFLVTVNVRKDESLVNKTEATNMTAEIVAVEEGQPMTPHRIVAKKMPPPYPVANDAKSQHDHDDHAQQNAKPSYQNVHKLEMIAAQPQLISVGGHDPLGYDSFNPVVQGGPGGAIAVVAIVCVGFLVLLVVMGVLKIRSTQNRLLHTTKLRSRRRLSSNSGDGSPLANGGAAGIVAAGDLTWDDDGMTITINPIEQTAPTDHTVQEEMYSDMSSDEDSLAGDEFSDEDDEDDEQVLPHLENNSRAATSRRHGSVSSAASVAATTTTVNGVLVNTLEWDDGAAPPLNANRYVNSQNNASFKV